MDWITPHLALGDIDDSFDPGGCDAVLNVAGEVPVRHGLPCLHLEIADQEPVPHHLLDRAIAFLASHTAARRKVLVHCLAGISRSPSVVAAFLALETDVPPGEALARVQEIRWVADPHPTLWDSVAGYVEARRRVDGGRR